MRLDKFGIAHLSRVDKAVGISVVPVLMAGLYRLAYGMPISLRAGWTLLVISLAQYLYFVGGYTYLEIRRRLR